MHNGIRRRRKKGEETYEIIIAEDFSKWVPDATARIQEAPRTRGMSGPTVHVSSHIQRAGKESPGGSRGRRTSLTNGTEAARATVDFSLAGT